MQDFIRFADIEDVERSLQNALQKTRTRPPHAIAETGLSHCLIKATVLESNYSALVYVFYPLCIFIFGCGIVWIQSIPLRHLSVGFFLSSIIFHSVLSTGLAQARSLTQRCQREMHLLKQRHSST